MMGAILVAMRELHAIISGRVQMVMFRDFTRRAARRLGLVGWVKNLRDGTVEVVAQGQAHALEELIAALHHGSMFSRVDSVDVEWREPIGQFQDFRITYVS